MKILFFLCLLFPYSNGAALDFFTRQTDGKCENTSNKYRIGLTDGLTHETCASKCMESDLCSYFVYNELKSCVTFKFCKHQDHTATPSSQFVAFRRTKIDETVMTIKRSIKCMNTADFLYTSPYESDTTMKTCIDLCKATDDCVKFLRQTDDGTNPKYRCILLNNICTESTDLRSTLVDTLVYPSSVPTTPTKSPTSNPTKTPTIPIPPTTSPPTVSSTKKTGMTLIITFSSIGVLFLCVYYFYTKNNTVNKVGPSQTKASTALEF